MSEAMHLEVSVWIFQQSAEILIKNKHGKFVNFRGITDCVCVRDEYGLSLGQSSKHFVTSWDTDSESDTEGTQ